jgi:hypothetical protein
MNNFDRISSIALFLLSLGITLESMRLSIGSLDQPGPGFVSFIAGISMAGFSFYLFIKNRGIIGNDHFWEAGGNKREIYITVGSLFLYAGVFEYVGFLLSTLIFLVIIGRFVAVKGWKVAISMSILITTGGFLIFEVWFQSQLPRGFLEGILLWISGKILF